MKVCPGIIRALPKITVLINAPMRQICCPRVLGLAYGILYKFRFMAAFPLSLSLVIQTLKDLPSISRLLLTFLGDLIIAAAPISWVKSEGQ